MKTQSIARRLVRAVIVMVGIALLTLSGTAIAANATGTEQASPTSQVTIAQQADSSTAAVASQTDDGNYAAREQAEFSKELADFQGGDTVIIGSSAVGVVLVVLILVVLL